ncbi:MAG: di-trans,poly-cis-decaprenylcistransferase [Gammaproteobacteria bacterium]|nr:di-trans,poly-cis-decaprenylcistransferase [Gammaproteobacteria bacterium]
MVALVQKRGGDTVAPRHVAVIMDGNGRWAGHRGLPRQAGHKAGIKPVRMMVEHLAQRGVKVLTVFAFSSENWHRPPDEINALMGLFIEALNREVAELDANGIRLKFIGQLDALGPELNAAIEAAQARTRDNERMDLVLAVAYGGRWDLAAAARALAREVENGKLAVDDVDETRLGAALATASLPSVDLLIRSGGERRISNFLLWDLAYSELYFSDVLWPDFTAAELDAALDFYSGRQRRFGRTGDQVEIESC